MDLASLLTRKTPQDLFAFSYSGILSPQFFVEGRLSFRHFSFVGSGSTFTDRINGTLMLDAAYSDVRKAAPKLLLVLDGGEEGNLDGTITLDGYRDDPNILFSFHYYRPWQFTHQGLGGMAAQ